MIWFFIGDVIDWLEGGRNISGVQRVVLELLFAAAECAEADKDCRFGACCFDEARTGLVAVPTLDALRYFRHWRSAASAENSSRRGESWPFQFHGRLARVFRRQPGTVRVKFDPADHFLFPGLVWSTPFRQLFRHMATEGMAFTVLVHDLIQIQRPDLVGDAVGVEFASWLEIVLQTATNVLVPSVITQQAIRTWAGGRGLAVRPSVFPVQFGMSHLATARAGRPRPPVLIGNYVLSVGTIDRRKNQELLLHAWRTLIQCPGPEAVPQLVLAGRLDIPALDQDLRQLIRHQHVLILEDATDADVAALYANCRFTLFPSLAEGFGLPVAESLSFGKVCIASDLPEIRNFAGDLVWYFSPLSESGLLRQIRRAIGSPKGLVAAERHIATDFVPPLWRDCVLSIRDITGRKVSRDAAL